MSREIATDLEKLGLIRRHGAKLSMTYLGLVIARIHDRELHGQGAETPDEAVAAHAATSANNDPALVRAAVEEALAAGKAKLVDGRLAIGFLDAIDGLP